MPRHFESLSLLNDGDGFVEEVRNRRREIILNQSNALNFSRLYSKKEQQSHRLRHPSSSPDAVIKQAYTDRTQRARKDVRLTETRGNAGSMVSESGGN